MTTINDARALIWNRIVNSGLVTVDRIDFGDGNQGAFVPPTTGRWVRPTIRMAAGGVTSLGGPGVATSRARSGTIIIQVFSDLLGGEYEADQLADSLLRLFEAQGDGPVMYRDFGVVDVGRDEAWWQKNVSGAFTFDIVCV